MEHPISTRPDVEEATGPGPSPDQSVVQARALDMPPELLTQARAVFVLALRIEADSQALYELMRHHYPAAHAASVDAGSTITDPNKRDNVECDVLWYLGSRTTQNLLEQASKLLTAAMAPIGGSIIGVGPWGEQESTDEARDLVQILDTLLETEHGAAS